VDTSYYAAELNIYNFQAPRMLIRGEGDQETDRRKLGNSGRLAEHKEEWGARYERWRQELAGQGT
jgi:hypothetical protein